MMPQGPLLTGGGQGGMCGPGLAAAGAGGAAGGSMEAWPSLVPDCSPGAGGNCAVAGTSETRRLDELNIASRVAEYSKDPRCVCMCALVLRVRGGT